MDSANTGETMINWMKVAKDARDIALAIALYFLAKILLQNPQIVVVLLMVAVAYKAVSALASVTSTQPHERGNYSGLAWGPYYHNRLSTGNR